MAIRLNQYLDYMSDDWFQFQLKDVKPIDWKMWYIASIHLNLKWRDIECSIEIAWPVLHNFADGKFFKWKDFMGTDQCVEVDGKSYPYPFFLDDIIWSIYLNNAFWYSLGEQKVSDCWYCFKSEELIRPREWVWKYGINSHAEFFRNVLTSGHSPIWEMVKKFSRRLVF